MVAEVECSRCGLAVSIEQYESSKFCPKCETFLQLKRLTDSGKKAKFEKRKIKREDVNVESLFYEYLHAKPIDVGGGRQFRDVDSWISARKRVYKEYREKFSPKRLHDIERVVKNYENWLLFENNLSWTKLHRKGYMASVHPERLADLLVLLQDDVIPIAKRVYRGLVRKNKVPGIAQGTLTALLHTFFNEKYGVWNTRTVDTLKILRRTPIRRSYSQNIGERYRDVNAELHKLVKELGSDLTTVDGFMWYISKFIEFI